jgi:hypothetical protein
VDGGPGYRGADGGAALQWCRDRETTGRRRGSGFGRILEHPICCFGWKAREYPDPMVGVASLVDRTACGLVGDVDPLPGLDIGQVSKDEH